MSFRILLKSTVYAALLFALSSCGDTKVASMSSQQSASPEPASARSTTVESTPETTIADGQPYIVREKNLVLEAVVKKDYRLLETELGKMRPKAVFYGLSASPWVAAVDNEDLNSIDSLLKHQVSTSIDDDQFIDLYSYATKSTKVFNYLIANSIPRKYDWIQYFYSSLRSGNLDSMLTIWKLLPTESLYMLGFHHDYAGMLTTKLSMPLCLSGDDPLLLVRFYKAILSSEAKSLNAVSTRGVLILPQHKEIKETWTSDWYEVNLFTLFDQVRAYAQKDPQYTELEVLVRSMGGRTIAELLSNGLSDLSQIFAKGRTKERTTLFSEPDESSTNVGEVDQDSEIKIIHMNNPTWSASSSEWYFVVAGPIRGYAKAALIKKISIENSVNDEMIIRLQ